MKKILVLGALTAFSSHVYCTVLPNSNVPPPHSQKVDHQQSPQWKLPQWKLEQKEFDLWQLQRKKMTQADLTSRQHALHSIHSKASLGRPADIIMMNSTYKQNPLRERFRHDVPDLKKHYANYICVNLSPRIQNLKERNFFIKYVDKLHQDVDPIFVEGTQSNIRNPCVDFITAAIKKMLAFPDEQKLYLKFIHIIVTLLRTDKEDSCGSDRSYEGAMRSAIDSFASNGTIHPDYIGCYVNLAFNNGPFKDIDMELSEDQLPVLLNVSLFFPAVRKEEYRHGIENLIKLSIFGDSACEKRTSEDSVNKICYLIQYAKNLKSIILDGLNLDTTQCARILTAVKNRNPAYQKIETLSLRENYIARIDKDLIGRIYSNNPKIALMLQSNDIKRANVIELISKAAAQHLKCYGPFEKVLIPIPEVYGNECDPELWATIERLTEATKEEIQLKKEGITNQNKLDELEKKVRQAQFVTIFDETKYLKNFFKYNNDLQGLKNALIDDVETNNKEIYAAEIEKYRNGVFRYFLKSCNEFPPPEKLISMLKKESSSLLEREGIKLCRRFLALPAEVRHNPRMYAWSPTVPIQLIVEMQQSDLREQITELANLEIAALKNKSELFDNACKDFRDCEQKCMLHNQKIIKTERERIMLSAFMALTYAPENELCCHETHLTAEDISRISDLLQKRRTTGLPPIASIDLNETNMTDMGVKNFSEALSMMPNGSVIDLGNNYITDEGLETLVKKLSENPKNIDIKLNNNKITDDGAAMLARLGSTFKNMYFSLEDNPITDVGIALLLANKDCIKNNVLFDFASPMNKHKADIQRMVQYMDVPHLRESERELEFQLKSLEEEISKSGTPTPTDLEKKQNDLKAQLKSLHETRVNRTTQVRKQAIAFLLNNSAFSESESIFDLSKVFCADQQAAITVLNEWKKKIDTRSQQITSSNRYLSTTKGLRQKKKDQIKQYINERQEALDEAISLKNELIEVIANLPIRDVSNNSQPLPHEVLEFQARLSAWEEAHPLEINNPLEELQKEGKHSLKRQLVSKDETTPSTGDDEHHSKKRVRINKDVRIRNTTNVLSQLNREQLESGDGIEGDFSQITPELRKLLTQLNATRNDILFARANIAQERETIKKQNSVQVKKAEEELASLEEKKRSIIEQILVMREQLLPQPEGQKRSAPQNEAQLPPSKRQKQDANHEQENEERMEDEEEEEEEEEE